MPQLKRVCDTICDTKKERPTT